MLNHFDTDMHAIEIQIGVAHALIKTLEKTLLWNREGGKDHRHSMCLSRALRLAVLCCALEMVFRCSSNTLRLHLNEGILMKLVDDSLLDSFAKLIDIFLAWEGECTIRNVALSKATRVMYLICTHSDSFCHKTLPPLFAMLQGQISSDIRVDVSCTIAALSVHQKSKGHTYFVQKFAGVSSNLISTLTTASTCVLGHPYTECITALFNLASGWSELRVKMSKRRDTIKAIAAIMAQARTRPTAMRIILLILSSKESLVQLQKHHPANGMAILDSLVCITVLNNDIKNQRLAVFALAAVLLDPCWRDDQLVPVIEALVNIVISSKQENLQIAAASALCKKLSVCDIRSKLGETVAEKVTILIAVPNESVQYKALCFLSDKIDMGHHFDLLCLKNEIFGLTLVEAIVNGTRSTRKGCFALLEKCSNTIENRDSLCKCPLLLDAIVNCVIDETLSGCMTSLKAVEVLLALMEDEKNIKHFQRFQDLLPWLASFANAITDNNELKITLVSAIIKLTTCHLLSS